LENYKKSPELISTVRTTFGKKIPATLVQFANTESIHYHNATLSQMMHIMYKLDFEHIRLYTEHHIKPYIAELPPDTSWKKRGYYYWAWKPFIILETLRQAPLNTIIIYADSGLFFIHPQKIEAFCEQAQDKGYLFFDILHNIKKYCKAECIPYMKNREHLTDNMVDGSLMFLKNTPQTQFLMQEWLNLCKTPYLISDESSDIHNPNDLDFIEHRHDQALLSIVLKNNNIRITGLCHQYDKTFTKHHRTRTIDEFKILWQTLGLPLDPLKLLNE
jgi:hypothetical protein